MGPVVKGGEVNFFSPTTTQAHVAMRERRGIMNKIFENPNGHQISQTKTPFWLDFLTDHEYKLRFHRGGLYKEKSEPQLWTWKLKNTKNSELSKIK